MLDVARACGFSVSTVSNVLSETPLSRNVAAKTREHIRAMALQLGYHPDAFARSLRGRRSQTVGILVFYLPDPFCIPVVRGIQAGTWFPTFFARKRRKDGAWDWYRIKRSET